MSLISSPRIVLVSGWCLAWDGFLSRSVQYRRSSPARWAVSANKCCVVWMQGWRRYSSYVTDLCGCFSVAAIQTNRPNQCNILYGDGWHVALKIKSVAFKYKLFCAMWIVHARSCFKGTAWKHSSRKEIRISSFILALKSKQQFKYLLLICYRNIGTPSKCFYSTLAGNADICPVDS